MTLEIIAAPPRAAVRRTTALLFVHGAWHGGWCWQDHFLPFFAGEGYPSYAVSLRGHGASAGRDRLRWWRIVDYVADLRSAVRELPAPPVLVGHAMGAYVVQRYLHDGHCAGAVLVAPAPASSVRGATLRLARRHPLVLLRANARLSLRPIVATPALVREALFSDQAPWDLVERTHARLQDESYRAYLDMLGLCRIRPRPLHLPLLVLGGERDGLFTPREFVATAQAWGADLEILPRGVHDMMLDPAWPDAAGRILDWLRRRDL